MPRWKSTDLNKLCKISNSGGNSSATLVCERSSKQHRDVAEKCNQAKTRLLLGKTTVYYCRITMFQKEMLGERPLQAQLLTSMLLEATV